MKTVVVIGDLNVDLILSGMPDLPAMGKEIVATTRSTGPGGSATNMAIMLAANGYPVRLYSRIGNDTDGRFLLDCLRQRGVPTETIAVSDTESTGITVALTYPHDRMFISDLGTTVATRLEDLHEGYLSAGDHLHLTSYFLQAGLRPDLGKLLAAAKASGMSTSLDPGHDPAEVAPSGFLCQSL
jgi:sugar/nucleoside kinase (ribokinase family)